MRWMLLRMMMFEHDGEEKEWRGSGGGLLVLYYY